MLGAVDVRQAFAKAYSTSPGSWESFNAIATSGGTIFAGGYAGKHAHIVALTHTGSVSWARTFWAPAGINFNYTKVTGMALAANGDLVVVGNVVAAGGTASNYNGNLAVGRFSANGTVLWMKSFDISRYDIGNDVAIDQSTQVNAYGCFQSPSSACRPSPQ